MKASKEFKYYVDGNNLSTINIGDEIPEIALEYAAKNGYSEKSKPAHSNKAKTPNLRNKQK